MSHYFCLFVYIQFDDTPTHRPCYKAVQHSDGDTICVRDCVLVKSGPRQKDLPYIAKVAELWKKDDTGNWITGSWMTRVVSRKSVFEFNDY